MRSILLIPAAAMVLGALVSCSNQDPGQAVAADTTSATPGSGGPFPTGSSSTGTSKSQSNSASSSPLKDTKPCSLLSASDVSALQAGSGKEEQLNNARACRFLEAKGFVMSVAIFDDLGLGDVTTYGEVKPVPTVGAHKAVQSMRGVDTCAISIEVSKTSRVDVQGTSDDGSAQKSCDLALRVARLVEPKLPG
jgi:Protein of unknown function (DUF3558)